MGMPSPTSVPSGLHFVLPNGVDVTPQLTDIAQSIGAILVILIAAALAIRLAHTFVRGVARALDTIETLAVNVIRFFVVVIAGLMILEAAFRLDIGPAIAGLGIAGIAVGLGTQHLVRDYLNGALILIENQYSKGDVVKIAGIGGVVEDFTLRRTTLRDVDGTVHTVPNGEISIASNLTRTWARINEEIRVVYGTDVDKAVAVIDRVGAELAEDPEWAARMLEAPHVERVQRLGEQGISLLVQGRVPAASRWTVAGELRRRLLQAFAENDITIPLG